MNPIIGSFGTLIVGFGITSAMVLYDAHIRETRAVEHLILKHRIVRALLYNVAPPYELHGVLR